MTGFLSQNPWFRKSRFKGGKGKRLNIGGGGLGYRERPGLGAESSVSGSSSSLSSLMVVVELRVKSEVVFADVNVRVCRSEAAAPAAACIRPPAAWRVTVNQPAELWETE